MFQQVGMPTGNYSPEQGKFDNIRSKCRQLNDAYNHWTMHCYANTEQANISLVQWPELMNQILQTNKFAEFEITKDYFLLERMAFLAATCKTVGYNILHEQILERSYTLDVKLPLIKLTCKELQTHFRYKCNSKCGVLSPLEFDHHPITFQSSRAPKRKRLETLLGTGYILSSPITSFEHAISQLHIDTGLNTSLTNICVFSALSTLCQKKVQIKFTDKKKQALCFSPIFISSSEETREALIAVLNIVYAPLKEYQEGLPYDEEEAKKGYRELDKTQRQRKKLDTASELYSQLSKRIKELENIPERYNFFITKWSPAKFFKQLQKHPESCCILDTEGNFIRSLLKNTRGTNDMIRFLTSSKTSGNFRYEDEDGQRHDIPIRPVTICSIITKEEYYTLTCRKTKHFKAFVDKMFPIFSDNQWLSGARTAAPPNEYQSRILELIDNVGKYFRDFTIVDSVQLHEMSLFHTSSKIGQDTLHTTLAILEETYNNINVPIFSCNPNYPCSKPNRFGNNILYHKEIMHEYDPTNPVVGTAKKINNSLLGKKQSYFRLSALQHDLLSNLRKSQIQAAIDWMIDEGDVQVTNKQFHTRTDKPIINGRAGQLYAFNLEKASAMERPHALAKVGKAGMRLSKEFSTHQQNLMQPQSSPANDDAEPIPTAVNEAQIIAPANISNTLTEQNHIEPANASAEAQIAIETQAEALIVAEDTPEVQSSELAGEQPNIQASEQASEQAEINTNQQHPSSVNSPAPEISSASCELPLEAQSSQIQPDSSMIADEVAHQEVVSRMQQGSPANSSMQEIMPKQVLQKQKRMAKKASEKAKKRRVS